MWSPVPLLAKCPTSDYHDYHNNYHDYMMITMITMITVMITMIPVMITMVTVMITMIAMMITMITMTAEWERSCCYSSSNCGCTCCGSSKLRLHLLRRLAHCKA